jgi:hypothetical protein
MSANFALRRIVRVAADGTGRSPEEVWMLGAAAVTVAVSVAVTRFVIRVVDFATQP